MKAMIVLVPLLLAVFSLAGCGEDDDGGTSGNPPGQLSRVTVTPSRASVTVGELRQFTAAGQDIDGRPVSISPVWSVSPANLGRIGQDGVLLANCIIDTGVVKATANGKVNGTSVVTLLPGSTNSPATLVIEPDTLLVDVGSEFAQLYLAAADAAGTPVAVVAAWDVVPAELGVIVNDEGLFESGNVIGSGQIIATVGGLTARAVLRVVADSAPPRGRS